MFNKKAASAFNKVNHDENADEEAGLRAAHAALSKMIEAPHHVIAPPVAMPPGPAVYSTPPTHVAIIHPPHPAFHMIMNAIKKPKAPQTLRVAPVSGKKV